MAFPLLGLLSPATAAGTTTMARVAIAVTGTTRGCKSSRGALKITNGASYIPRTKSHGWRSSAATTATACSSRGMAFTKHWRWRRIPTPRCRRRRRNSTACLRHGWALISASLPTAVLWTTDVTTNRRLSMLRGAARADTRDWQRGCGTAAQISNSLLRSTPPTTTATTTACEGTRNTAASATATTAPKCQIRHVNLSRSSENSGWRKWPSRLGK
mmetsp:Transcript_101775/g.255158  ORF Transcript_101775/g.255158 Transcript_101775/m.255158 type:complete len:215 (+) Transcript_101775:671-1315(+)